MREVDAIEQHRQLGRLELGAQRPLVKHGQLEAALQLVSRQGVLSEGELLEFRSAVETLASRLQLPAKCPEMRDALEAARALDGICAESTIGSGTLVILQV